MTYRSLAALLVASLLASPLSARDFRAENKLWVNAVGDGGFEVIEAYGYGATGMWCAAAHYAKRVLGVRGTARLYVEKARGASVTQPGRKAATFTLDPAGLTPSQVFFVGSSTRTPGANFSIDHAYGYCIDFRLGRSN